ncbi:PAAR domain-containing protein, partial [Vibrio mimicus]
NIIQGSMSVLFNNRPAVRMGDLTAHGGIILMGMPNVLIGD